MLLAHVIAALVLVEFGERGLNLGADAYVAQFLCEAVDDNREEHVAGGIAIVTMQGGFGIGAEPFMEFLADSGEAVEGDILKKFHGEMSD